MKPRIRIAQKLADDLSKFDGRMKGRFMCPVCTTLYDCHDETNITDGHIIPDAVGGSELTLLCRVCNSRFGAGQDKWFGEYLDVLLKGKTFLSARTKSKYLTINGVKVRGGIRESADGDIDVFLHINRNPPGLVESIAFGSSTDISVDIPLARNEKQIQVGYLTAAYLMWFKQLGYSWVFQSHLDSVRRQIQNPLEPIIEGSFLIDIPEQTITKPWIGVLDLGERSYPCSAIFDRLVIFPTIADKNVFTSIQERLKTASVAQFHSLNISSAHNHAGPMGLIYKNNNLVFPDHFVSRKISPLKVLFFPDSKQTPIWLSEVSEAEAKSIKDSDKYAVNTIKVRW